MARRALKLIVRVERDPARRAAARARRRPARRSRRAAPTWASRCATACDRGSAIASACAWSRPTARTPIGWRRCSRAWGLAPEVWRGGGAELLGRAGGFQRGKRRRRSRSSSGSLARGFRLPADRLALVAEEEIFGARSHREAPAPQPRARAGRPGRDRRGRRGRPRRARHRALPRPQEAGRCAASSHDFLHLEYDGGTVYVPVYRIGLVHRYSGAEAEAIRLDKLGGKTWLEKRRRVSAEARKIAEELLQLYAQRAALAGHAFPGPDADLPRVRGDVPVRGDAGSGASAIETVLDDMQNGRPDGPPRLRRRRLRQDRGGAARGAAGGAGRQAGRGARADDGAGRAALRDLLRALRRTSRCASPALSRFRTKAEQQKTIAALAEGKLDVVVGTHRILSRDVRFKDLGLVVIDEEQRFGVAHKERLKELRTQVDVLTLTATPIPRTLQMAMGGLREISIIATPPADRLAIRTFVCRFDPALLGDALAQGAGARRPGLLRPQPRRGHRASGPRRCARSRRPGTRIAIGHGQMADGELEKVMVDFVDGTLRRAGVHDDHRVGPRHPARQHDDRQPRRPLRPGAALPDARAHRPLARARVLLPGRARRGADHARRQAAAGGAAALHRARRRLSGRDATISEIRGAGELLGDRQSGVGRRGRLRDLREDPRGGGRRAQGRADQAASSIPRSPSTCRRSCPTTTCPTPASASTSTAASRRRATRTTCAPRSNELADRYGPLPDEARLLGEVMVDKTHRAHARRARLRAQPVAPRAVAGQRHAASTRRAC